MRRCFVFATLALLCMPVVNAAIVTNTNQSVYFYRLPAHNASTDVDAVYYNQAGVMKLKNGFHLAVHNQTLFQDRIINSTLKSLNNTEFQGKTKVPVYPNAYAIYKTDGFALSFGFGPNAGGGSAEYEKGLPSFETPISMLPLMISAAGLPTSRYSAQISFEGESIFYGFQANASFALSDAVAVAGGVRYIYAVNKYEGSLTNILVNSYHPLLNPTQQMIPAKTLVGAQAADKSVDVKQVGSGITPIVGLSLTPAQNLKIGVRYEFNTKIELENETAKDDLGAYPDGRKERSDIPPVFAVGAEYGLSPNVRASVSYTLFLEKQANWEGREETLDGNSYDLALGLEFDLTKAVTLSGGYIYSRSGAREKYKLDTSYDLDSDTYGAGLRIRLGSSVDLDLGGIYVKYKDQVKKMAVPFYGAYEEKYKQKTTGFGIGLNFHL